MQICVYNHAQITAFLGGQPYAVVDIARDLVLGTMRLSPRHGFCGLLRLSFAGSDTPDQPQATLDDAQALRAFIDQHAQNKTETLIVMYDDEPKPALSVAFAVADVLGIDRHTIIYPGRLFGLLKAADRHVYLTMLRAWGTNGGEGSTRVGRVRDRQPNL